MTISEGADIVVFPGEYHLQGIVDGNANTLLMVACLKSGRCPLQSSLPPTSRPFLLKTPPHHTCE
ncbi:hypothetical protein FIBSPDRAFT_853737 [Athelia psychrophila]|uniref:Uncharacterized protein n=1 Tax=Athelia psychrophila TaxID=1759441 RepID=A0A166QGK5_9AGAM|nr:hypothetical protein FIBSPDRAFT_853737 [Fibularhizoctonia sp. CBS 109695]